MYSAAVFLCVVYRVTSGFTVTASHNFEKIGAALRCSGCTIRLLELCKAFGVQTENPHSQSSCGDDQIRLYELTLSCPISTDRSCFFHLQNPDAPWLTGLSALANTPKGGSLTRRRKGTVSLRRFEKEMAFVKSRAGPHPAFFQAPRTARCAPHRGNPQAAALKTECRTHRPRAAVPRRKNRTSALHVSCAGPCG